MATLALPPEADPRNRRRINSQTGDVYYIKSNYSTNDALSDLIYYVTETGDPEDHEMILSFGAVGTYVFATPEELIQDFQETQTVNHIDYRKGRRVYHEILIISPEEARRYMLTPDDLWEIGLECAKIYLMLGFQAVFAVHQDGPDSFHLHFVVNSISVADGTKWQDTPIAFRWREVCFNEILKNYYVNKTTD